VGGELKGSWADGTRAIPWRIKNAQKFQFETPKEEALWDI